MKLRNLALSVSLLFLLPACADLLDPAAAVVNGEKITPEDVRAGVADFEDSPRFEELSQEGDAKRIMRQFEQGYLATLVRRAVLEPRADELGIEITDDQVEGQIEVIEAEFPDEAAFEEALEGQALTEEDLRALVNDQILEDSIKEEVTAEVEPTEAEIEEYYEDHLEESQEMQAQHILVDRQGLARRLADELQDTPEGGLDRRFRALARQHSTDTTSVPQGGVLAPSRPGQLVPEFEQAAAELEVGEVSEPVQSQFGWHVIRVLERTELSVDDRRDEIANQLLGPLQEEAWAEWLEHAYEDAGVRINPRYGELDPATGQITDASAGNIPGGESSEGGDEEGPGLPELDDHGHDH